jgi:xylulose-5-phosphate/fructose-6-phosphate phosphoketolase
MLYLRDNPLLREPLKVEHIKHRLLGHWGSSSTQSFIWAHLNRVIKKSDLSMIYLSGPGHGAPGVLAPVYLEGTYSEIYADKSEDSEGTKKFSNSFHFLVVSEAAVRLKLPALFMWEANWATAFRMPTECD